MQIQPRHVQSHRKSTGETPKLDNIIIILIDFYSSAFFFFFSFQEDFDIFFTPSDYEDPNIRKNMQEHHMVAYENTQGRRSKAKAAKTTVVANDCDGKTRTISTEAGVRRLGRQLQRTEQELWSDLALRALRVGKVEKALMILRSECAAAAADRIVMQMIS